MSRSPNVHPAAEDVASVVVVFVLVVLAVAVRVVRALVVGAVVLVLVVLAVQLPVIYGYEVCRRLRDEFGAGLPLIFVSAERTEPSDRIAGLLLGADEYLAKPVASDELLARVRALLRRSGPMAAAASGLTSRELEILRLLADGLTTGDIARQLFISRKTVGTHIEHILRKLGVHSRTEAVAVAYREGLVGRT